MESGQEPAEGGRQPDQPEGADTAEARPAIADPDPVDAPDLAEAQNDDVDSAGS